MGATGAGRRLELDRVQIDRLADFAALVRASPHNLLSSRALEELEDRHIPECLGLAAMLPRAVSALDVGTGGGFPGMIVAIARPDVAVTLLDSTTKKVQFLADAAASLGVSVATLDGRSEELVRARPGSFDVVTARAVAPLDRLLGWTIPWLRPGGTLYALKGARWEEELRVAVPELRRRRAAVIEVTTPGVVLHDGDGDHPPVVTPRVVTIHRPG